MKDQIIELMRGKYKDFGPQLACEKLNELEGLPVSRESLRRWMIDQGLWSAKKAKNRRIHQSRAPRPRFGELVQIDGCSHDPKLPKMWAL